MKGLHVGCIGVEIIEPTIVVIKHIAVLPSERGKGVGKKNLELYHEASFLSAAMC